MLLQSIELQNFRQFINEKIDFSTDPERNVTLIIGENGTGKTTFAQAFFWCLYGETDFTNKTMLNRVLAEQMTPDQKVTVKVVLKLTHGSAAYEIVRTQEYKKSYSNKVTGANTVLNIAVKSADGNTRYLKQLECEAEIKKILPKELSNYFFFDGERIEKMSKEVASGRKSSGFSNAVVGLTGLKATLIERFEDIYTYAAAEPNAQPYRNRAGGNLLFRPVALLPFVRAAVKVSIQQKKDFDEIFGDFPQELLYIDNIIWRNTLWNSDKGTMIVNNQKLTERILLYYWDRSTLTAKEISTMKLEIKSNLQLADMEDVETLLADAIDK